MPDPTATFWFILALVVAVSLLLSAHTLAILARNEQTLLKARVHSHKIREAHQAALREQEELQSMVEVVEDPEA